MKSPISEKGSYNGTYNVIDTSTTVPTLIASGITKAQTRKYAGKGYQIVAIKDI